MRDARPVRVALPPGIYELPVLHEAAELVAPMHAGLWLWCIDHILLVGHTVEVTPNQAHSAILRHGLLHGLLKEGDALRAGARGIHAEDGHARAKVLAV
jgi:hypothetical protein